MKWLKDRKRFLNEAKIGDVILPRQKKEFIEKWGEKYLDYEEVSATENIDQGVWKLSESDKRKVLGAFFSINVDNLYDLFKDLPIKFIELIKQSIDTTILSDDTSNKFSNVLSNFDIKNPSLDEIYLFYENIFRKISISETKNDEILLKDESGRPVMGEDKKPIKVKKEKGEVVFSKNLVNLYSFLQDYNDCYSDEKVSDNFFAELQYGLISKVKNFAANDFSGGDYKIDFGLFQKDMYLSILHNPKDILNMSISKFYASCQHLYTGRYSSQVIGNVFDPNSIPAYIKFDSPIIWDGEKISDQVPICRTMIRNIYNFDKSETPRIAFDRVYPDRGDIEHVFYEIIKKYSKNSPNVSAYGANYIFSPDIGLHDQIESPYMDRPNLREYKYIGVNAKSLRLTKYYDWSRTIISDKSNIKELIIETTDIPANLMKLNLNLDFVVFKFIDIKSLLDFNFKTKNYGFDKCKLNQNVLEELKESEKLKFISCDIKSIDFSKFNNLKELHLVYSLEDQKLSDVLGEMKLEKLVISGDLLSDSENKKFISDLKKNGTKVEIEGLKL